MTHNDLHEAIRKESTKARTKTNEAFDCMERIGHMLIELKTRFHHGTFMDNAERVTGLPQRSINRYMAIARDPDGFRNRRRGIPAEEMLTLTKKATASNNRIEHETKVDTVSILPAVEPPAPRPPTRPADIVVDAVIVEAPPQAPLETTVETEVETEVETTVEIEVEEPPLVVDGTILSPATWSTGHRIIANIDRELVGDPAMIRCALADLIAYCQKRLESMNPGRKGPAPR